jgi:hypothetical protein
LRALWAALPLGASRTRSTCWTSSAITARYALGALGTSHALGSLGALLSPLSLGALRTNRPSWPGWSLVASRTRWPRHALGALGSCRSNRPGGSRDVLGRYPALAQGRTSRCTLLPRRSGAGRRG